MIRFENGIERKKIVHFLLLEKVGLLQGELKIETVNKLKKCCNCALAHVM